MDTEDRNNEYIEVIGGLETIIEEIEYDLDLKDELEEILEDVRIKQEFKQEEINRKNTEDYAYEMKERQREYREMQI